MAHFLHGFVYELDIPEDGMLTIEGVKVDGFERTPGRAAARLPDDGAPIQAENIEALVSQYVELTGASAAREARRREQLPILRSTRGKWNAWRRRDPTVHPMLADVNASADFPGVCLDGYDFSYANLTDAKLSEVSLRGANFHQAILANADLSGAHLEKANFCRTD